MLASVWLRLWLWKFNGKSVKVCCSMSKRNISLHLIQLEHYCLRPASFTLNVRRISLVVELFIVNIKHQSIFIFQFLMNTVFLKAQTYSRPLHNDTSKWTFINIIPYTVLFTKSYLILQLFTKTTVHIIAATLMCSFYDVFMAEMLLNIRNSRFQINSFIVHRGIQVMCKQLSKYSGAVFYELVAMDWY